MTARRVPARRIGIEERRARLAARHHLAPDAGAADVVSLAGDLVGLHATDPPTVFLSAAARLRRPDRAVAELERALYDDRSLVRTLCMRRTMFVVPLDVVPIVQAACTDSMVAAQRKRLVKMIEANGIADDGTSWLRQAEAKTLAALEGTEGRTGAELSRAIPELREQLAVGEGTTWAGTVGVSTRVLFLLSTEQLVVRGRPKGSWTSSQYRWLPMRAWLPAGVPAVAAAEARTELLRRWLSAFGPATAADVKWWTGWSVTHTRAALADAGAVEVALDGGPGWVVPGDEGPAPEAPSWVALLPALDPTTMGWQERRWYLGEYGPALFDRNGNAGPTVWVDGRIVGGWTQREHGEIVYRLLEDVGREASAAVDRAAETWAEWLGETRIKPRFPAPLQRELSR